LLQQTSSRVKSECLDRTWAEKGDAHERKVPAREPALMAGLRTKKKTISDPGSAILETKEEFD